MLDSGSIEEMFDHHDWSEEDLDEKDVDASSELLSNTDKNEPFLPDKENTKDAESTE